MNRLAKVYAQALYCLGSEQKQEEVILSQMEMLQDAFSEEPAFLQLLAAPNIPKDERCAILDNSFRGNVQPYLLNFLKILTEKGHIRAFSDCCKAYREIYDREHGIVPVSAVTAVPLTGEQMHRLTQKLEKITGKTVRLVNRIDPACLGGVRLDYDGKRVDGTVQNRLKTVHAMLENTVL